jgi:hypothetical protein
MHFHSSFTGHCFPLHRMHVCWVHKSVRYASVCSLQSAGETQSGPAGYQTDTRHSRVGLSDWEWPAGGTGTVPSHAETTEQLHTSPPGDKTVQLVIISIRTSFLLIQHYLILISYLLVQVHAEHWRGLEYSTVWYISGVVISDLFYRILSRDGKVLITSQRIRYTADLTK